ncbi:MAG: hypothetical protein Q8867_00680 [Bacteroidota bacterium]|nr:hypothetical protein [Bacteroidota bacterium]
MMQRKIICIICGIFISGSVFAREDPVRLKLMEDSLYRIMKTLQGTHDPGDRIDLNRQFAETLNRTLYLEGSFDYPFDSLKFLARLTSPDKEFRIYNWNLPDSSGKNTYFAYIQWNEKKYPKKPLLILKDYSDSIREPETVLLDARHWYGVLYYKIIPTDIKGKRVYTLLGWDGGDPAVTCKVIDVFSFDKQGGEIFGSAIFHGYGDDKKTRIIFRFSSESSMALRYQEQFIPSQKKWNSKKKEFEYSVKKEWAIVFDRLVPLYPDMDGQYRFYVPSGDAFDGFILSKEGWSFVSDIDARNH